MILFCPIKTGIFELENGFFTSTEMGKTIAREIKAGTMKIDNRIIPVHPPETGLLKLDFGPNDHLKATIQQWQTLNLPNLYKGETLKEKKLIVFPMHALGDQLYLATALRCLANRYKGMQITIVRSQIPAAEKWYPYIYFDDCFELTESTVNCNNMKSFNYYVDAEHFAHLDTFKCMETADFFLTHLLHHDPISFSYKTPKISPVSAGKSTNSIIIETLFSKLRRRGKPVVLVNLLSTGRTRDLPVATVLEFASLVKDKYSLIFSTFNNKVFEEMISQMNDPALICTGPIEKDVSDLIEIILRSDGVITTDSGITHLSEALETPCGSVFNVARAEDRTKHYRFGETLAVDFELPGICKTPCHLFALDEGELCPGMHAVQAQTGKSYYEYPPCVENLTGVHLRQLLDLLSEHFFE